MNLFEKYPPEYSFDIKTKLPRVGDFKSLLRPFHLPDSLEKICDLIHPNFFDLSKSFAGDWTIAQNRTFFRAIGRNPISETWTLYFSDLNDCLMAKMALL